MEFDDFDKSTRKTRMLPSMLWKQKLMESYTIASGCLGVVVSTKKFEEDAITITEDYKNAHETFQTCVVTLWAMLRIKSSKILSDEQKEIMESLDKRIAHPHRSLINIKKLYPMFQIIQYMIEDLGLTRLERLDPEAGSSMA